MYRNPEKIEDGELTSTDEENDLNNGNFCNEPENSITSNTKRRAGNLWQNFLSEDQLVTALQNNATSVTNPDSSYQKYRYKEAPYVQKSSQKHRRTVTKNRSGVRNGPLDPIKLAVNIKLGTPFYMNKKRNLDAEMSENELTAELAYRLRETNFGLLKDIITCIGTEATIRHFEKTNKIQLSGGLPINDVSKSSTEQSSSIKIIPESNLRRKTSGGIFLSCVYSDDTLDTTEIQKIRNKHRKLLKEHQKFEKQRRKNKYRNKNSKSNTPSDQILDKVPPTDNLPITLQQTTQDLLEPSPPDIQMTT